MWSISNSSVSRELRLVNSLWGRGPMCNFFFFIFSDGTPEHHFFSGDSSDFISEMNSFIMQVISCSIWFKRTFLISCWRKFFVRLLFFNKREQILPLPGVGLWLEQPVWSLRPQHPRLDIFHRGGLFLDLVDALLVLMENPSSRFF